MKRLGPMSLAARLTFWYTLSGLVVIGGVAIFLYWGLTDLLVEEDDRFLADHVHVLRILLKDQPENVSAFRQEVELETSGRQFSKVYARVLRENGSLFVETPGMANLPANIFPPPIDAELEPVHGTHVEVENSKPFRVMTAYGIAGNASGEKRIVQIALDRENEAQILARYRTQVLGVSFAALLLWAASGYQIARRGIRPLKQISETARRIRSTTLHERIEGKNLPRELLDLSSTFNDMFDRLEDSFARLSRFSADLAHELRTPINNLRGEMEVTLSKSRSADEYRATIESALEECERFSRINESLLFLAHAESPKSKIKPEKIDLVQEIRTVREFYEVAARETGIALTISPQCGGHGVFDRILFQRALGNLIENSLKFTPRGGHIFLDSRVEKGVTYISVTDTGCGISQKDLPYVFDRFFKADPSRDASKGGSGLGLAIVKSILELHRGTVEIESTPSSGTKVTLTFPAA